MFVLFLLQIGFFGAGKYVNPLILLEDFISLIISSTASITQVDNHPSIILLLILVLVQLVLSTACLSSGAIASY